MNAYVNPTALRFDVTAPAARPVGARGPVARAAGALRWLMELPRRRAVIAELQLLTDRELADIGLSRGDLPRLFEADFAGGVMY